MTSWDCDPPLSNHVACQGPAGWGCHGVRSLIMALRMVRSFRMEATMATFVGLPSSRSR